MAALPVQTRYTEAEYLALESEAEYKSEYIDGHIVAMTGATESHNLIVTNLLREVSTQLKGRPCKSYPSDMRVHIPAERVYTYPDVSVICGDAQFEAGRRDTLLNPTVIIEVLSRSTETYDRVEKFAYYRRLPSLREYVLISQDKIRVEQFRREGNEWVVGPISRVGSAVQLASVGCVLQIDEIYDKVEFE